MKAVKRGAVAESIAATWALQHGWVVCFPARGQQPVYDLVMDTGRRLRKVQVKRAYLKNGKLNADLYHGTNDRYTKNEIDVFLIVDVDGGQLWWLPLEDSQGKTRVVLTTPHMEQYRVTPVVRRLH